MAESSALISVIICFLVFMLLQWNISSVFSIIMQEPFVVNDSQAFILFTYTNLRGFLMFKLLLMRQTLFDFDVLLPCNLFMEKLVRRVFWGWARWSPGETDTTSGKDSFRFLRLPLLYDSSFCLKLQYILARSHVACRSRCSSCEISLQPRHPLSGCCNT